LDAPPKSQNSPNKKKFNNVKKSFSSFENDSGDGGINENYPGNRQMVNLI
jgi:hypothetical protein